MSVNLIASKLFARIKLPPQDLANLSFCSTSSAAAVGAWAGSLPATRINHTSVVLYKILPEFSRLQCSPDIRLAMLENVRPYVQRCIQGLAQSFLNKPVVLPEDAMKAAIVALALQRHLSNSYCIAARDFALQVTDAPADETLLKNLACASHRAINGLGIQLMRSYQLYANTPGGVWLTIHSLFRVALKAGIKDLPIEDEMLSYVKHSSMQQSYHRILLLASTSPNKMRQFDVSTSHKLIELWSDLLVLHPGGHCQGSIHSVNLQSDSGPTPKSLLPKGELEASLDLDVSPLLDALEDHLENDGSHKIEVPNATPVSLLQYLLSTWGEQFHRQDEREAFCQKIDILVGMTSVHFHLCLGLPFENFILSSDKANISKQHNLYLDQDKGLSLSGDDPWDSAFDAGGSGRNFDTLGFSTSGIESQLAARERDDSQNRFPIGTVESEDRSRTGYCLKWKKNVPKSLRSGEIVAVREGQDSQWTLAIIRWLKQAKGVSHFGVEMISSLAKPFAASVIHKDSNDEDFMRAFLIPEQKSIGLKSALLTPAMPFQEGHKVKLNQRGNNRVIQLNRKIMTTGSISQFEYRVLET